jgi:hypothetical protein
LTTSIQLAGNSAAVVQEIAGVCGSTIAYRIPLVDVAPFQTSRMALVMVPNTVLEDAAPPAEATASA